MVVLDSVFLFLAGWLGWRFLERIGLPVASLFGGMLAVGILSLLEWNFICLYGGLGFFKLFWEF